MKKIILLVIFLILLISYGYSKKFLVITNEYMENYAIKYYLYDYSEFDSIFFFNLTCKNFEFPANYKINNVISYLLNRIVFIKSSSKLKNFDFNYKAYLSRKIIIDSKYKILEKDGKKYYIFNVCFPSEKKENTILKFLKNLFNG